MWQLLKGYVKKMQGGGDSTAPGISWRNALCSWLGAFIGIALIAWLGSKDALTEQDHLLLFGPFGATAVLVYGSPMAMFAQPRYVVGGHFLCAIVGVSVFKLIPDPLWLSAALAVSLSTVVMYITHTTHPPGGATALLAVIGSDKIHQLGYAYAFDPVLEGVLLLLLVALVMNNLSPFRQYPYYWW